MMEKSTAGPLPQGTDRPSVVPPSPPVRSKASSVTRLDTVSTTPPMRRIGDRWLLRSKAAEILDRSFHATVARFTLGLSPAVPAMAYADWWIHLGLSPGKQMRLAEKALRKTVRLGLYSVNSALDPSTPCCIEPLPQDKRFSHEAWQRPPYNFLYQGFLLNQQWWHNATTEVRGVSKRHEAIVSFFTRQYLDMVSPSNAPWLNPEILEATVKQRGMNLVQGAFNLVDDVKRQILDEPPAGAEKYQVGRDVAVTPGKVVYRNRLMELIQYSPSTETVRREPVLMLSAWMMKYYIMDLSPHNSMVKYLVDRGHTVFMISWVNPGSEDHDLGMEDYRRLGIMDALDVVSNIVPGEKVHAVGYCLGGILLTIAAAAMARDGDERLATITLFTTLTDFTEVGELSAFMHPSQVIFLEDMMWKKGYLEPKQATSAFQLMRSKDLIWSKMLREYFRGKRAPMFDLMAWNADGTRMPYRQHSELLRRLFVNNDLAQGRYLADGRPIALSDIHGPIFAVSAERDHVAPWRSVYKLHLQADSRELTFVLSSGGHNVGIINEPGHPARDFQMATHKEGERYIDPETWQLRTPKQDGSWWPAWAKWLAEHSTDYVPARPAGAPEDGYPALCDAPGTYVFQR